MSIRADLAQEILFIRLLISKVSEVATTHKKKKRKSYSVSG